MYFLNTNKICLNQMDLYATVRYMTINKRATRSLRLQNNYSDRFESLPAAIIWLWSKVLLGVQGVVVVLIVDTIRNGVATGSDGEVHIVRPLVTQATYILSLRHGAFAV